MQTVGIHRDKGLPRNTCVERGCVEGKMVEGVCGGDVWRVCVEGVCERV